MQEEIIVPSMGVKNNQLANLLRNPSKGIDELDRFCLMQIRFPEAKKTCLIILIMKHPRRPDQ